MSEEMNIFKSYLRLLLSDLKDINAEIAHNPVKANDLLR